MKRILPILFCLWSVTLFAANPSFKDFSQTDFFTNALNVSARTHGVLTNMVTTNGLINDLFVGMRMGQVGGGAFGSVNRYGWTNLMSAVRARQMPCILIAGDGLAGSGGVPALPALCGPDRLTNYFNFAGTEGPLGSTWYYTYTGGGIDAPDHAGPVVLSNYRILPNQGDTFFTVNAGNYIADYFDFSYVERTGAGSFSVRTQINGGAFTLVPGMEALCADAAGYRAKNIAWSFPVPVVVNFMVSNITSGKSVEILTQGFRNTQTNRGMIYVGWNGNSSVEWSNTLGSNSAVTSAIFKTLNPTVVIAERLTWGFQTAFNQTPYFIQFLDLIRSNNPSSDLLLTGCYPIGDSILNSPQQLDVQTNWWRMRTNAVIYKASFFDALYPFMPFSDFTNRGFLDVASLPHATVAGGDAYNQLLYHWLDPFNSSFGTFDPGSVSNLFLRLDMDAVGVAQTNRILCVRDDSGRGFHMTSGTNVAPVLETTASTIGQGRRIVAFSGGTTSYFTNLFSATTIAQPVHYFFVMTNSSAGYLTDAGPDGVGAARNILITAVPNGAVGDMYSGTDVGFTQPTGWHILEACFDGATSLITTNGASCATNGAANISVGAQGTKGLTIGSRFSLDTAGFAGDLAYVLAYNRHLTRAEAYQVRQWLGNRFGIDTQ